VLIDPPYDMHGGDVDAVLATLADGALVAPEGTVVVERRKSGEPLTLPDGWRIEKERAYGDTLLVVAHAG
jgi:16S rRNA G966 N2-methylase RsmD